MKSFKSAYVAVSLLCFLVLEFLDPHQVFALRDRPDRRVINDHQIRRYRGVSYRQPFWKNPAHAAHQPQKIRRRRDRGPAF